MRLISSLLFAVLMLFSDGAFAQVGPAYTNRDCSIASLSGSSQTIAVANPNRKFLGIYNSGATTVWVNVAGGTAAVNGTSSIVLPSTYSLIFSAQPGAGVASNAITVIGTAAQPLTCFEGR